LALAPDHATLESRAARGWMLFTGVAGRFLQEMQRLLVNPASLLV